MRFVILGFVSGVLGSVSVAEEWSKTGQKEAERCAQYTLVDFENFGKIQFENNFSSDGKIARLVPNNRAEQVMLESALPRDKFPRLIGKASKNGFQSLCNKYIGFVDLRGIDRMQEGVARWLRSNDREEMFGYTADLLNQLGIIRDSGFMMTSPPSIYVSIKGFATFDLWAVSFERSESKDLRWHVPIKTIASSFGSFGQDPTELAPFLLGQVAEMEDPFLLLYNYMLMADSFDYHLWVDLFNQIASGNTSVSDGLIHLWPQDELRGPDSSKFWDAYAQCSTGLKESFCSAKMFADGETPIVFFVDSRTGYGLEFRPLKLGIGTETLVSEDGKFMFKMIDGGSNEGCWERMHALCREKAVLRVMDGLKGRFPHSLTMYEDPYFIAKSIVTEKGGPHRFPDKIRHVDPAAALRGIAAVVESIRDLHNAGISWMDVQVNFSDLENVADTIQLSGFEYALPLADRNGRWIIWNEKPQNRMRDDLESVKHWLDLVARRIDEPGISNRLTELGKQLNDKFRRFGLFTRPPYEKIIEECLALANSLSLN